jgi:hypothetical protein
VSGPFKNEKEAELIGEIKGRTLFQRAPSENPNAMTARI